MLLFALAPKGEQEPAESYSTGFPRTPKGGVQIVFISVETYSIINMLNSTKSCQKSKVLMG